MMVQYPGLKKTLKSTYSIYIPDKNVYIYMKLIIKSVNDVNDLLYFHFAKHRNEDLLDSYIYQETITTVTDKSP